MIDVVIAGICGFMAGSFTTVLLISLLLAGKEDKDG